MYPTPLCWWMERLSPRGAQGVAMSPALPLALSESPLRTVTDAAPLGLPRGSAEGLALTPMGVLLGCPQCQSPRAQITHRRTPMSAPLCATQSLGPSVKGSSRISKPVPWGSGSWAQGGDSGLVQSHPVTQGC